jgi:2-haloacid dehalogenase
MENRMAVFARAVVFDLFGTLLDVASLRVAVSEFANEPDAFVAIWRQKQLGYAFAATSMGRYEDFDVLTARALEYAARTMGLTLSADQQRSLVRAWNVMEPFADAKACLTDLRAAGVACDVLTNSTVHTSMEALDHAGLAPLVDTVHSIDDVRLYKPSPRAYEVVSSSYRCAPHEFVFVTCNGWDATGAAEFGMRVAWCNRLGAPLETFGKAPMWTISTLTELVPALGILVHS